MEITCYYQSIGIRSSTLVSKAECEKFMGIVERFIPTCIEYKKLSNAILKYKKKKYG